mmetsp:Transcript_8629/g.24230  ORF Transcript_8629/g.24230 Transcript_8629/m.24230 type:complete len:307 (+) Transcript_8629:972-1892(+)
MVDVLCDHGLVLLLDLFLQLLNLMIHHLELLAHLGDFLVRLQEVLGIEVLVSADGLVEVLLLAQFGLLVRDAFLQVGHVVISVLQFLARVLVPLLRHGQLPRVLLPLPVKLQDALQLQLQLHLPPLQVLPQRVRLPLVPHHQLHLLSRALVGLDHGLVEDVALVEHIDDLLAVNLRLLLQLLHLSRERSDLPFQLVPRIFQARPLHVIGLLLLLQDVKLLLELCLAAHQPINLGLLGPDLVVQVQVVLRELLQRHELVLVRLLESLLVAVQAFVRGLQALDFVRLLLEVLLELGDCLAVTAELLLL